MTCFLSLLTVVLVGAMRIFVTRSTSYERVKARCLRPEVWRVPNHDIKRLSVRTRHTPGTGYALSAPSLWPE